MCSIMKKYIFSSSLMPIYSLFKTFVFVLDRVHVYALFLLVLLSTSWWQWLRTNSIMWRYYFTLFYFVLFCFLRIWLVWTPLLFTFWSAFIAQQLSQDNPFFLTQVSWISIFQIKLNYWIEQKKWLKVGRDGGNNQTGCGATERRLLKAVTPEGWEYLQQRSLSVVNAHPRKALTMGI